MPNFWNSSKSKQIRYKRYICYQEYLDTSTGLWLRPDNKPFLPIILLSQLSYCSVHSLCHNWAFSNQIFPTPNNYPGYLPSLSIELAINPFLGGPSPKQQPYPLLPPPINYHLECFTELYAVINPCPSKPNISKTHQNGQTCVKNGLWGAKTTPRPLLSQPSYDFF